MKMFYNLGAWVSILTDLKHRCHSMGSYVVVFCCVFFLCVCFVFFRHIEIEGGCPERSECAQLICLSVMNCLVWKIVGPDLDLNCLKFRLYA